MYHKFILCATLFALVFCEMDHSTMNMPMSSEGSVCSQVKDSCANCTALGCNWCSSGMGLSFCTDIDDKEEAGCTMDGCSADAFVKKTSDCFGGCSAMDTCSHCSAIPGCGWCHQSDGGAIGCMETMDGDGMTPKGCSVFTVGTCELPCDARTNCQQCTKLGSNRCEWCHDTARCDFVGVVASSCVNNVFDSAQCSANIIDAAKPQSASSIQGNNGAHLDIGMTVMALLLMALVYA